MAERACNECKQIEECRDGLCSACRSDARKASDRKRPTARQRGYDTAWERTRAAKLELTPLCEHDGCDDLATDVDHVDGLGPRGPLGHDMTNLRSFCHPHHSQRTARDQPGGWNTRG